MAKVRKPLLIGPFKNGLNTSSDPTDVLDDEVVEALNFDKELNGSFKSRPAFTETNADLTLGATGTPRIVGIFYRTDGTQDIIASDGLTSTWRYTLGAWVLITNTFAAAAMTQFDNKAWLLAPVGSPNPGGYWVPAGFTADPDMPKGVSIAVYKERMFVAAGAASGSPTAMYYSKLLPEGTIWNSYVSRLVNVSPGDGQAIVSLMPYYNSLLVFRTQSIFSYQYASSTAAATISILVPGVGLASADAIVAYENYIYFMYDDRAYEFIDNRAQQVNTQVPFRYNYTAGITYPFTVSLYNDRVIFSYYDVSYVFSTQTRAWTRWISPLRGPFGKMVSFAGESDTVYLFSSVDPPAGGPRTTKMISSTEVIGTVGEAFECVLQTKNYNYGVSSNYKRMFWWGVDAIFRKSVTGEAVAVVRQRQVTWADLLSMTWAEVRQGTWRNITSDPIEELTTYSDLYGQERMFVKFRKAMRFRQVYFVVRFTTEGTIGTAPVALFTINVYLNSKQTVSDAIS